MPAPVVEAVLGAGLRWNEQLLNRFHPIPDGPLDPRSLPWTAAVEAAYPEVRAELDAVIEQDVQLPTVNHLMQEDQGSSGRWASMIVYSHGRWIPEHVARAPRTAELLRSVPGLP